MSSDDHRRHLKWIIFSTLLLMTVALLVQLSCGMYSMSWKKTFEGIFCGDLFTKTTYFQNQLLGKTICGWLSIEPPVLSEVSNEALIIWNIRIPRFLVGICVGINLALAGCIFQAITKNAMASAYTLGISQGSGLSMLLILICFPSLYEWLPLLSMTGGAAAFFIIYATAWKAGMSPVKLVLSGVIIGSISIAIQKGLYYFIQDVGVFQDVLSWTTGSLVGLSWKHLRMILPWTVVVSTLCMMFYKPLNLMMLGDSQAKSLGVSVEKWRFIFAFIGILAASSAVSVAGLIGFVGLITPHICRSLVGYDYKNLFMSNVFMGACLLTCSDTLSRIIMKSGQIPVGIIMNTVGGVFFIFLMVRRRKTYYME